MRIAFDFDNVIRLFDVDFLEWYNSKNRTTLTVEDFVEFDEMPNILGVTNDELWTQLFPEFYRQETLSNMNLVQGAKESLIRLCNECDAPKDIVTASPAYRLPLIRKVTDFHTPSCISDLFSTGSTENKAQTYLAKGYDIVFEDHGPTIIKCAELGMTVYPIVWPWTGDLPEHENIRRFTGDHAECWQQATEEIIKNQSL